MTVLTRFSKLYDDLSSLNIGDLDTIYHPNIQFDDPVASHQGIDAVKQYFTKLLVNTQQCTFTIHQVLNCNAPLDNGALKIDHAVVWTMHLMTPTLNKGKPVHLEGSSFLSVKDDRIVYHRDYYDMGQMVYEHVPVLGFIVRKIKQRLAVS